jgi:hypothetical protein
MGEIRNAYRNIFRKPEGKRSVGRLFVYVDIKI